MAKVFISHASEDIKAAWELHRWLVEGGHKVFLDQDPRDGIAVGEDPWKRRLQDRLRWANAISRPRTSNDNPYSEAEFKTLEYVPDFPDRFGCLADARAFCDRFFPAYNHEHRHSCIGMHTPASVHYGTATEIRARRQAPPGR